MDDPRDSPAILNLTAAAGWSTWRGPRGEVPTDIIWMVLPAEERNEDPQFHDIVQGSIVASLRVVVDKPLSFSRMRAVCCHILSPILLHSVTSNLLKIRAGTSISVSGKFAYLPSLLLRRFRDMKNARPNGACSLSTNRLNFKG